jgi:GntR family transcriptional regulator
MSPAAVDRLSPLPVYFQLAGDLRRRLAAEEWKPGERIPPELRLAEEYGVSRVTIRQALAELVRDDVLERHRGSGTYVRASPHPLVHDLSLPPVYAARLREQGFTNVADVLEACVLDDPPGAVREALGLGARAAAVTYLMRRIVLGGEPTAIYRSWLASELVPGLHESDLIRGSLSLTLSEHYGLHAARSDNRLEAVMPTREEAELLDATVDTPLLVMTTTTYLADDRPLEHLRLGWRGDRVRFNVAGQPEIK